MIYVLLVFLIHELGHIITIYATRAGKVTGYVFNKKGFGVRWEPNCFDYRLMMVRLSGSGLNLLFALVFWGELFGMVNFIFGLCNLVLPGSDGARCRKGVSNHGINSD